MDKDIAQFALAQCIKKGADEVVIGVAKSNSRQIKFVNNEVAMNKAWVDKTMDLIVIKDKKIAVTRTRNLSNSSVEKSIGDLFKLIGVIQPNPLHMGLAEGPFRYKKIKDLYDRKIECLETRGMDLLEAAVNTAIEEGARRTSGVLEYGTSDSLLLTSNNVAAEAKASAANFSIRALLDEKSSGHRTCCSRTMAKFDPISTAKEAGKIASMAQNPKNIPGGKYQVLFSPLPLSNLLNTVISSASIHTVETGYSFLINKLSKQVANPKVTMWDNGRLPGGMASSPFDEEGVPTRKTTVIKNGVLKTYLHNTSTARRYKTKTTANAGIISPEPTNCILKQGKYPFEKLIAGIDKGIWVTNLWYTRFQNYMTGDFSTIPRDGIFLIKNGGIEHPTSDIRISDNLISLMKNISAIGRDSIQVIGWDASIPTITPSVVVDGLTITKSKFELPAVS